MTKDSPKKPAPPHFLLIDFENIQKIDLARIHSAYRILVFSGANQTRIPIELVRQAQPLGNRLEWKVFRGQGKNALDFFIAYEMGKITEKFPNAICTIVSGDKGFDPLLAHMQNKRYRRISDVAVLTQAPASL